MVCPIVVFLLYTILFFIGSPRTVDSCLSSGIGCGNKCCGTQCHQQFQEPLGGCNCQSNMACGPYGCYRVRNRAALASVKTKTFHSKSTNSSGARIGSGEVKAEGPSGPAIEPSKIGGLYLADIKFMDCCQNRRLPDFCLSKCTFEAFNRAALTAMYLRQDRCPVAAVAEMQYCAAQGKDHRDCCDAHGVANTAAGPKCLVLCDQVPGKVHRLDTSYMSCFDRFESIKGCFWRDIMKKTRKIPPIVPKGLQ